MVPDRLRPPLNRQKQQAKSWNRGIRKSWLYLSRQPKNYIGICKREIPKVLIG